MLTALHFHLPSAVLGFTTAFLISSRPKSPTFHLVSITLSSFHLSLPFLDIDLTLTIHVSNPNPVPIVYSPSTISISYNKCVLGSATLHAGSQAPMSCQLLQLPATLSGLQMASHAGQILADAARREMKLEAEVDIEGTAKVLFWGKRFSVHVESSLVVDPVFLDVVEQENKAETHLYVPAPDHGL